MIEQFLTHPFFKGRAFKNVQLGVNSSLRPHLICDQHDGTSAFIKFGSKGEFILASLQPGVVIRPVSEVFIRNQKGMRIPLVSLLTHRDVPIECESASVAARLESCRSIVDTVLNRLS